MSENLAVRWMRRYKLFFLIGLAICAIQVFLAYKSLKLQDLPSGNGNIISAHQSNTHKLANNDNSVSDDEDVQSNANNPPKSGGVSKLSLSAAHLGFQPECELSAKEAISAVHRARTKDCKQHIARTACAIQSGKFYPTQLRSYCPKANFTGSKSLGCFQDEKEFRLLSGYFNNFKTTNSPQKCTQMCLQSGFPYAGVQYGAECFCGNQAPPNASQLPDPKCNMKCTGDTSEVCGGFFTMNIYETGIKKFTPQDADTSLQPEVKKVRIAFLLTLNGRAVRQVHRLIKALFSPNHFFYIHVDSRQDYLYRELLKLEQNFTNIKLARKRFSTIWGGASLLTMLLHCMSDLLASTWEWDFVINLSESDFPVKPIEKLTNFLTANQGKNFVKSHGRETQRFIQKQGLDKTFVECDTHMWRIGDRALPEGIQVDGGSDWIALSKSFVQFVTNSEGNELIEGLSVIFKHTLLPAESFFHTVLRNSNFCGTYVDNNLHVTNWKRKLGCKCQYKHVVDWCGCSPNDFKPEDWGRLIGTEHKMLFFARKFEPIINQAVILQLERWMFGENAGNVQHINSYWQSFYHAEDKSPSPDDATLSIATSLLRIISRKSGIEAGRLKEITNFKSNEEYKGFILSYTAKLPDNETVDVETRIRPIQFPSFAKNSKLAKRIKNFEVSSDYDLKEQISRNFPKFLGPHSDPVLTFQFAGIEQSDHTYNLTVLWIDPAGTLQDYTEIHIEDSPTDSLQFYKASLNHPVAPGIWTVKLIGRSAVYIQTKFLIAPLTYEHAQHIQGHRALALNAGSQADIVYPPEWETFLLPTRQALGVRKNMEANSKRFGSSLHEWADELVAKFFHIRESCSASESAKLHFSVCHNTTWSTLAPDPKSDVYSLLANTANS